MKARGIVIGVTAVFVGICLLTLGVGLYFFLRIPKVEHQIAAGSTPIHVQLYTPESPAGWPMNSYIPVIVQANGGGAIASIELYVNGQLYEQVNTPLGWEQSEYAYRWDWQPGTHRTIHFSGEGEQYRRGDGCIDTGSVGSS